MYDCFTDHKGFTCFFSLATPRSLPQASHPVALIPKLKNLLSSCEVANSHPPSVEMQLIFLPLRTFARLDGRLESTRSRASEANRRLALLALIAVAKPWHSCPTKSVPPFFFPYTHPLFQTPSPPHSLLSDVAQPSVAELAWFSPAGIEVWPLSEILRRSRSPAEAALRWVAFDEEPARTSGWGPLGDSWGVGSREGGNGGGGGSGSSSLIKIFNTSKRAPPSPPTWG